MVRVTNFNYMKHRLENKCNEGSLIKNGKLGEKSKHREGSDLIPTFLTGF